MRMWTVEMHSAYFLCLHGPSSVLFFTSLVKLPFLFFQVNEREAYTRTMEQKLTLGLVCHLRSAQHICVAIA
jgi:hypothetical protein